MPIAPEEIRQLGNPQLLQLPKTAFFCSRAYPVSAEQPTYRWALEQRAAGHCVVSGFHSQLEQSVFRYLLQGRQQPIVYALGRGIQPSIALEYGPQITAGHLLFITPFEPDVQTITQETADIRNLLIADLADQFFIPYAAPNGLLAQLLQSAVAQGKPIFTLNLPENEALREQGALLYRPSGLLGRHSAPQ